MQQATSPFLIGAGRWLLALYFFGPGMAKFLVPGQQLELMARHGVPAPELLLIVAGIANVVGALLFFANRYVLLTSLGFALYILVINLMLHDFWNFSGIEAQHETQNFFKNLGILAGLLVLAGASPWRAISLQGLKQSDAQADA
ncbi:DoxX family membrane protein [Parvibaculaceae bacterium PLY_AMNH_Bact1]|nr:DoxX family membrane protein [Parvibaculaceae bacterium PLY_AMNH_Bact1]